MKYINAVGHGLIRKCVFAIGGSQIDQLNNRTAAFWEELSGQPGKRLFESIGRFETTADRGLASRRGMKLYSPLQFSFSNYTGLALPIVSLQFHSVDIEFDFHAIADVVEARSGRPLKVPPRAPSPTAPSTRAASLTSPRRTSTLS